ncbi:group II intron reverse transcriptase/maturase [Bacillus wiedmannii]|uniref:group II intron reverse transcriptase/maturase n=1 Tax=Bacillus wiedmannii TaxID=1890302 RepID=UPI001E2C4E7A|nr:group II intron reverse transcriptase/maturase [Bacillus wiedmannii]MCC2424762.1 group II intron reverse transcriptase/maturase [Bacillus wiedmannii]
MNKQSVEYMLKNKKIRHSEYYGMTERFDELYQKAKNKQNFRNLMRYITADENILLAYRNIKRNKGSQTPSMDKVTIREVAKMTQEMLINFVKQRFNNYQPRVVRRKEIPKPNGEMRPLGIPSFWDRLIQQCILQVLEPICEANFHTRSYGFRPNRSAENAIADATKKINIQGLTQVVDVDIKGFFDEVNHAKLIRQLWTLGIRDKQLLVIIRKILKAPVLMPNGKVMYPLKGTPQGGILSPLLANINLNEFDWWISNQWETFSAKKVKPRIKDGIWSNDNVTNCLARNSNLKPMYIVRYADDFKIFTNTKSNADKIFMASKLWLERRLKLPISEGKSRVTNLKKQSSEFLGFTLKAVKKGKRKSVTKYVAKTHIAPKALKALRVKLSGQIRRMQKSPNSMNCIKEIGKYNSMVIGMHNYYSIATHISLDLKRMGFELTEQMYNRFPKAKMQDKKNSNGFTNMGEYNGKDKGLKPYLKSKALRYLMKVPIIPVSAIKHRNPMMKRQAVNKYTEEGRKLIHARLKIVSEEELKWLREHPILSNRATIELNDNRISLFVAQNGKCGVTGEKLDLTDMHCHHKKLWSKTHDDSYQNLILIKSDVHRLIHATKQETINKLLQTLNLNEKQLLKLNKLRKLAENEEICI